MRRLSELLVCLLLALSLQPMVLRGQEAPAFDEANAFVTRWSTYEKKPIKVPLYGHYSYRWERADGTVVKAGVATVAKGELLELPVANGNKFVLKAGPAGVKRIEFGVLVGDRCESSGGTTGALVEVSQWGSVKWESFAGAFYGCERMGIAEGAGRPDLSGVKTMQSAFRGCKMFNPSIDDWDVSRVTNMRDMFSGCSAFDQPLGKWDVSKVTNMKGMFSGCSAFDQPLGKWDVSEVTNMEGMFSGCSAFDQPLGKWDVSKVTNMGWMFSRCLSFDQPLEKWDVSQVTHMDGMFNHCLSFNQPLEKWDVSRVTDMWGIFRGCSSFDRPLGGWTLSALAGGLGLQGIGLSVGNYSSTLAAWAAKRDQLQAGVRVDALGLFFDAAGKAARQQLIDETGWNFGYRDREFASPAPLVLADAFITRWTGTAGQAIRVPLYGEYSYEWVNLADGSVIASGQAHVGETLTLKLEVPADGAYELRAGPEGVQRIEFGIDDGGMLLGCRGSSAALLRVDQWGSVAWKDFRRAFYGCVFMSIAEGAGKPDLRGVESLKLAFGDCATFNSPVEGWDVSEVTDMKEMFRNCSSFDQPLEKWDVSKVTDMEEMFRGCSTFNQPLEKWDVSKVTDMEEMFRGCSSFNQPLEKWDVSKVTNMWGIFDGCESFNRPLGAWTLTSLKRNADAIYNGYLGLESSGLSASNYSSTLLAWAVKRDQLKNGVKVVAYGLKYSETGKAARQQLIDDNNWEFSGDSEATVASPAVEIVDPPARLTVGDTHAFQAKVLPAGVSQQVTWSVAEGEAWGSFTDNMLKVKKVGLITVKAKLVGNPNVGASTVVKVLREPESVAILNAPAKVYVNYPHAFQAKVSPAWALQEVTWSVAEGEAWGVFTGNVLTPKKTGTITVKATAVANPMLSQSVQVTVEPSVALTGIAVSPTSAQLVIGAQLGLTVGYTPADATNKAVTWSSSDESVATVSAEGKVTGVKKGSATITATAADGGRTATCTVTVVAPVPLAGIAVSPISAQLKAGETQQLTVSYTPEDATNRAVTWSSDNESVATVDAEGLVTGKGEGSATITATAADGGHTATCAVTVEPSVALTSIAVSPTSAQLKAGETQQLTVGYTPEDATNKAVTWSSSDESVATVDAEGLVTGKGKGSATITATAADGGHTATCAVTVAALVPLTGITVSPTSAQLKAGETQQLTVSYTPEGATNRAVTWSSDNESVATVDAEGLVTGKGEGSATITATAADGGHRVTCEVTVEPSVALTSIAVSPTSAQLKAGETQQLTVGYTPEDATNRAVTWSSSDESVATVDAEGLVTGKGKGSATITATAADGGHTATCAVTVAALVPLTGITVSPTSAQLEIGAKLGLTVGYTPADATNKAVTWSSSNESVATVSAQGKVTGKGEGSATITATATDGGHMATCAVTVKAGGKPSGVESALLSGVSVSPNPFGEVLAVQHAGSVQRYALVNASGTVVLEGAHAGGEELMLVTSHLPAGIYWLRLVAADGERAVSVAKQ